MTLYASTRDQALLAANAIAKLQDALHVRSEDPIRAGTAQPLMLALGINTIDASAAITDFLGHGYFSHDVDILSDIEDTLRDKAPPRAHLLAETLRGRPYWKFLPQPPSGNLGAVNVPKCPGSFKRADLE